jgi:hypothetical protein
MIDVGAIFSCRSQPEAEIIAMLDRCLEGALRFRPMSQTLSPSGRQAMHRTWNALWPSP